MEKNLEQILDDALAEQLVLQHKRNHKRRVMLDAETKRIDAELEAEYGVRLAALTNMINERRTALEDHNLAAARLKIADRQGLLVEWGNRQFYSTKNYCPTGRRGILQVCERGTQFPTNINLYSLPKVGDLFIRLVKKDGTAGLGFILYSGEVGAHWLPVGKTPTNAA